MGGAHSRLSSDGEIQTETAAAIGGGIHADGAAHAFSGLADNGQADACARIFRLGMHTLEKAEDFFARVFGDTDTVVHETESDVAIEPFAGDADARMDARSDELHSVSQKVGDNLRQVRLVTQDRGGRTIHDDLANGRMEVRPFVDDLSNQRDDVNWMKLDIVAGQFAVRQNILDEAVEATRCVNRFAQEILVLSVEARLSIFQDNLQEAVNGAKRRAHIMRQAVGEAFEFANGGAKVCRSFSDQLFEFFFGANFIGDVACDLRRAYDVTCRIANGGNGKRNIKENSVFSAANRFEVFDALPAANLRDDTGLLLEPIRRKKHGDRFAENLGGGVAKDSLCSVVPTGDGAVQVFAENCVIGGFDNGAEQLAAGFGGFARGNVADEGAKDRRSLTIDTNDGEFARELRAVGPHRRNLHALPEHAGFTCGKIASHAARMRLPKRGRDNQIVKGMAENIGAFVTEDFFRS